MQGFNVIVWLIAVNIGMTFYAVIGIREILRDMRKGGKPDAEH